MKNPTKQQVLEFKKARYINEVKSLLVQGGQVKRIAIQLIKQVDIASDIDTLEDIIEHNEPLFYIEDNDYPEPYNPWIDPSTILY